MVNTLMDLVAQARDTIDGDTGAALVLVLHRLRRRRAEDARARSEMHLLFQQPSVLAGPRAAA